MGFFDVLSGAISYGAEEAMNKWLRAYEEKLRNASDSVVQSKWDEVNSTEVSSDPEMNERIIEATRREMRRRNLLY